MTSSGVSVSVGIVVPCFNEASRLTPDAFIEYLASHLDVVFCFVDDASTDATASVLSALQARSPLHVRTLRLERNAGKAEAVRRGILSLAADESIGMVGYLDADLAAPLDQIDLLRAALAPPSPAVAAFGSRVKMLGRRIERWPVRHYFGRVFATFADLILGLGVYDTQCGAKLFRRDIAAEVFAQPFMTRWLFDVEIFARLIGGLGREVARAQLVEVPLTVWTDTGDSKVGLKDLVRVPIDLMRIAWRYRISRR